MVIKLLLAWFLFSAVGAWLLGWALRAVRLSGIPRPWRHTFGQIALLVQRDHPTLEVIGATQEKDGTLAMLLAHDGMTIVLPLGDFAPTQDQQRAPFPFEQHVHELLVTAFKSPMRSDDLLASPRRGRTSLFPLSILASPIQRWRRGIFSPAHGDSRIGGEFHQRRPHRRRSTMDS